MAKISLRRHRLVRELQKIRENAGLTVAEAAKRAGFSHSKLSRIENFQLRISGDDTHAYCVALEVSAELTEALVGLARHARNRGDWWLPYSEILGRAAGHVELEADSYMKFSFMLDAIPGLLQTAEYCYAMHLGGRSFVSKEKARERVKIRLARQERLKQQKLTQWAVIDELALLRHCGGHAVMADQLDYLAEAAEHMPNVSIQVLPLSAGAHLGVGAQFDVFMLRDGFTVVANDGLLGCLFIEEDEDVREYEAVFSQLAAQALTFDHSIEQLRALSDDHRRKASVRPHSVDVEEK